MAKVKVIGTIEARMGSSRLPGKTMKPIYRGRSLLELVVTRFNRSRKVDKVIVATTNKEMDDPIALWCEANNVPCFRGSENDVLNRVVGAASLCDADVVVQMGADSAYLDPFLVDELISLYKSGDYDYVANDLQLTYPLGIYAHVVKFKVLERLNRDERLSDADRQDVVRPIFEHVEQYKVLNVVAPERLKAPELRLTIDYLKDLELARKLYEFFDCDSFTTAEIVDLFRRQPDLFFDIKQLPQHSLALASDIRAIDSIVGTI